MPHRARMWVRARGRSKSSAGVRGTMVAQQLDNHTEHLPLKLMHINL